MSRDMHPVQQALDREPLRAFTAKREARSQEEILADFSGDDVVDWRAWREQRDAAVRAEEERREQRERTDRIRRALAGSDIPSRYRSARFEKLERSRHPEAFDACVRYAECSGRLDGKSCLLLKGPPGTGKTTLAIACLHRHLELTTASVRYVNLSRTLQRMREGFRGDHEHSLLELTRYSLLVLDDLGRQRMTEWVEEQFFTLIDALYADCRRVVFTTNSTTEQLQSHLDEAVRSRISEMAFAITVGGHDLRAGLQKRSDGRSD